MAFDLINRKVVTYEEALGFDAVNYVFNAWLNSHQDLTSTAIGHTRVQWQEGSLALILTDKAWQSICYKLIEGN